MKRSPYALRSLSLVQVTTTVPPPLPPPPPPPLPAPPQNQPPPPAVMAPPTVEDLQAEVANLEEVITKLRNELETQRQVVDALKTVRQATPPPPPLPPVNLSSLVPEKFSGRDEENIVEWLFYSKRATGPCQHSPPR